MGLYFTGREPKSARTPLIGREQSGPLISVLGSNVSTEYFKVNFKFRLIIHGTFYLARKMDTQSRCIGKCWDRYISLVHKENAKFPANRWYVIRVEAYIGALRKKLQQHKKQDVEDWFKMLGRKKEPE